MSDRLPQVLGELADLDTERLGVRPAPAAELRARGDRHRRRRNAASALAVAAAVAVIGIGAVAVGGSGPSELQPAPEPTPSSVVTPSATEEPTTGVSPSASSPAVQLAIPKGFPLTATYPDANEDGTPVRMTARPGVGPVSLCGESILTSAGASDVAGTKYVAPEDFRARTLLLFEDPSDAAAVVEQAERVVRGCPEFDFTSNTPVEVGLGDTSFGFDQRLHVEQGGFDLALQGYQVVQVGRAVLISTALGEANGSEETRAAFNQLLTDDAREVVAAMAELG